MLAPQLRKRQQSSSGLPLAASSSSTTSPTPSLRPSDQVVDVSESKANLWKYALVVIFAVFVVLAIIRLALIRRHRERRKRGSPQTPSLSGDGFEDTSSLPPYRPENSGSVRSRWSLIMSPRGPTPPAEPMSEDERRRRRLANIEIRQALIDAGLLLGPQQSRGERVRLRDSERAGLRRMAEEMLAEEERFEQRAREERRARRERREARRERRRMEEEGAGLPAYSQKASGDEEVLEMGEGIGMRQRGGDSSSSSEDEDEDDTTLLRTLDYAADPPRPPQSHPRP
ncbi:hypothetical protein BCR35DRAFT_355067 [Leucosporidium creatinivorum]|uniref:Uncharacterized protein n=1 Tax=Leucosporidium creatinivorum TaxID=106004 RepID=A0A1Y2DWS1_9BASI|nr:hypothetical protein BCR35DRAFT_355067 [Leucosporidium creatinivorum]